MVVFKRKQVVVLSLVLMIIVAGYLQYSYKKSSVSTSAKDGSKLGEAVYVDNKDSEANAKDSAKDTKTTKDTSASKQANDYFTQAKLEKEITRGKDTDALKAITVDQNATKDAKAKAYEQMMKIVSNSEKELAIETLLKEKGFNEALVLFGDDGSVDVVVKVPALTSANTAQITDIVTRQAKVSAADLHIKNIY